MLDNRVYTGEEIKLLQEDDENSSHAEMIVKALGALTLATDMRISWAVGVDKNYSLVILFKKEEDLNQLLEGRETLSRFSPFKVDPHVDVDAYAAFCNRVNSEATRGEFMASVINVVMDHLPGERKYAVGVDTTIPTYLDVLFCFSDSILCDQIGLSHKLLHTNM
jgi:hypothetical protein